MGPSLSRPVLVLASALSYWITCTAPARPSQDERSKQTSTNEVIMGLAVRFLPIPKVVCLSFAVMETISTLSFYLPDEHVPFFIRSFRGSRLPDPPSALFVAATLLCILSGVVRVICYRTLGTSFTFYLSIRKSHSLITTGPYAYVRHPSYTSAFMVFISSIAIHLFSEAWLQISGLLAVPAVKAAMGVWVLYSTSLIVICVRRIEEEDKLLKKTFGKEWEDWAARVKYRLIPGIY